MPLTSFMVTLGASLSRLPFTGQDGCFAAYIGEAVTFSFDEPLLRDAGGGTSVASTPVVTVVREPSGSALSFTAGAATPTHAGLHTVTIQNGALPALTVRFVVYPAAALTHPNVKEPKRQVLGWTTVADPAPRTATVVREILQRYTLEQARAGQDLTTFDALTTPAPLPASVNWASFAPDGR